MWSGDNHERSFSYHVCCCSPLLVRSPCQRQTGDGTNPRGWARIVTGYNSAYHFLLLRRGIFNSALEFWAKAFLCCTLSTNVLVTGLIAGRIWTHGRKLNKSVGSLPSMGPQYWGILAIVIESGALYSSALVIEIALYASKTNAIYVLFDGMAQVIVSAVCFCLNGPLLMPASTGNRTNDDCRARWHGEGQGRHHLWDQRLNALSHSAHWLYRHHNGTLAHLSTPRVPTPYTA
jgi:hypothetical protein